MAFTRCFIFMFWVCFGLMFFRRAETKPILTSSPKEEKTIAEDYNWDARFPNIVDRVGLYAMVLAAGFACLVMAAHLFLLLCLLIDSVSTTTIVVDRTFKRSSIPKIILDRVIQNEEYDDVSWDEILDTEGIHTHEQLSEARQDKEEIEIIPPKEDRTSVHEFNKEDHLRWIKTIYYLVQISHAVQVFINREARCVIKFKPN